MTIDPFSPEIYRSRQLRSARDVLLFALDTAQLRARDSIMDIRPEEYDWEPLSAEERRLDLELSADTKQVWRVFQVAGRYTYDYGERSPDNPAFTTVAWIMNHVGVTADMYLYCIKSGKPAGEDLTWDDLPVHSNLGDMRNYVFATLQNTRDYLLALEESHADKRLNESSPLRGEKCARPISICGAASLSTRRCMQCRLQSARNAFAMDSSAQPMYLLNFTMPLATPTGE